MSMYEGLRDEGHASVATGRGEINPLYLLNTFGTFLIALLALIVSPINRK